MPDILLKAARAAYANYYGPKDAEAFALYNAGYWFSCWTNTIGTIAVAEALGVDHETYVAARTKAKNVAILSDEKAFKESYDEFRSNLKSAIYE